MAYYPRLALGVAALLFALFAADVLAGKLAQAAFLSEVGEALVLFAAVIAFVAGTLLLERLRASTNKTQGEQP